MEREGPGPEELVAALGPHPATRLGLDLDARNDADLGVWLVASILLGGRTREDVALAAVARLRAAALATPAEIAAAEVTALYAPLEAAAVKPCEGVAAVLARVCAKLEREHAGSIDRLAAPAEGLDDLARRLASLGTGFGRAAVWRFLTPLRGRWSAASDLPATPAVASAAWHLGQLPYAEDGEGAPAAISRWAHGHADTGNDPAPRDVEAALDRLGRAACLRGRPERCPLGSRCPRRGRDDAGD